MVLIFSAHSKGGVKNKLRGMDEDILRTLKFNAALWKCDAEPKL